jgi:hypothetical protein
MLSLFIELSPMQSVPANRQLLLAKVRRRASQRLAL